MYQESVFLRQGVSLHLNDTSRSRIRGPRPGLLTAALADTAVPFGARFSVTRIRRNGPPENIFVVCVEAIVSVVVEPIHASLWAGRRWVGTAGGDGGRVLEETVGQHKKEVLLGGYFEMARLNGKQTNGRLQTALRSVSFFPTAQAKPTHPRPWPQGAASWYWIEETPNISPVHDVVKWMASVHATFCSESGGLMEKVIL